MFGISRTSSQPCNSTQRFSGIRVVLLAENLALRRTLQMVIAEHPAYTVVGCVDTWEQCEPLLAEFVPELLIAEPARVPAAKSFDSSDSPLILRLRINCDATPSAADPALQEFRHELLRIAHELCSRKACELSTLLEQYMSGLNRCSYLSTLNACDCGEDVEIPATQIRMIEASGNYVRIYTAGKVCIRREPISCLQTRLDPDLFLRAHRSYLVNLQCISHLAALDSKAPLLVLHDGQTIPIGPNYRDEIKRLFAHRQELIA